MRQLGKTELKLVSGGAGSGTQTNGNSATGVNNSPFSSVTATAAGNVIVTTVCTPGHLEKPPAYGMMLSIIPSRQAHDQTQPVRRPGA